jgi:hypothetical protein
MSRPLPIAAATLTPAWLSFCTLPPREPERRARVGSKLARAAGIAR